SSQNHFMLGHAEEWLFRHLAGLQIDFCKAEGEQLTIQPSIVGDLDWVCARVKTPRGTLGCSWERNAARVRLKVSIPAGNTARVVLPGTSAARRLSAGEHVIETAL
ncbi:MAG: hypothetical protein NZ561_10495, partial [Phycisphaerae bacterium]|nr:hypothetical protein [Phycisphaerae bacterium]